MDEKAGKKPFESALNELKARRDEAYAMGGAEKTEKRRAQGHLNARERLDLLLDPGSFNEFGLLAKAYRSEVRHKSAADGKIAGFGTVNGRPIAVISNDFTVLGASSSVINGKKMKHVKDIAAKHGMPVIFLGESSGARMPDRMGAPGRAILGQDASEYRRIRRSPWISALLGDCYGSSTWYTCLSDLVVMRKGATMAVASSRVTSLAIGQPVDQEELGGWRLHSATTGLVDRLAETDEEAIAEIRTLLGYLPSHNEELPPSKPLTEEHDDRSKEILDLLPESRSQTYDGREVVKRIVDHGSFYELKERFGKSILTGLARLNGQSVGMIVSNPKAKGGAIDVESMRKVTSFLVLCDSFNIPLIFLVDQPGFLIGIEGEKRTAPGRIMNWMNALSLCTVPKIAITMRKNYGQAYLNMGGGRMSDVQACWPMSDFGFMDPKLGVNVLFQVKEEDDPERFAELVAEIEQDSSAWALAGLYEAQAVIAPTETRRFLIDTIGALGGRTGKWMSEHLLSNWPTSY